MRVVYKKSISQHIIDVSIEAEKLGRIIDKVLLSQEEYNQLVHELRGVYGDIKDVDQPLTSLNGILVEREA